jgi:predicted RNA-binding Zn ribbon-like protein
MERLELIRDFVNTWDADDGSDVVEPWLAEHGLRVGARDAVRVREAIRDLLLANNGVAVDVEAASRVLAAAARRARLRVEFADGEARVHGTGGLGALLAALAEAMRSEEWQRLKACRADTCRWAFVDHARNRSRAWCSMSVCGNRQKAQRFRERHAA